MTDDKIVKASLQWVKQNSKKLKHAFCDEGAFPSEKHPVTIFMAGTPGAGKTEFSKSLLETFDSKFVRIDADEIREMMREIGYTGANAALFQRAVGNAVNNIYSSVLKHQQSALIDGTFAYGNWHENVDRSLKLNRLVEVYYLYQDPDVAWSYVKIREQKQGRAVPRNVFIDDYLKSIENVTKAKEIFGDKITIYFAKNNYQKQLEYIKLDVDRVADFLPKIYNREELEELIQ